MYGPCANDDSQETIQTTNIRATFCTSSLIKSACLFSGMV